MSGQKEPDNPGKGIGLETFDLHPLAFELAGTANSFGLLPDAAFRGFLIRAVALHFTPDALALHLFLQRFQRAVDIIITNKYLHGFRYLLPTNKPHEHKSSAGARLSSKYRWEMKHLIQ